MADPLRIGLFVDSLVMPVWVANVIDEVERSGCGRIDVMVVNASSGVDRRWFPRRLPLLGAVFRLDRWHLWLESRLMRLEPDVERPRSLHELAARVPVLRTRPRVIEGTFDLGDDAHQEIGRYRLDVALLFGFGIPASDVRALARYGFWALRECEAVLRGASAPGSREVLEGTETTLSYLVAWVGGQDGPTVLHRSHTATDARLGTRLRNTVLRNSTYYIPRVLRRLGRGRPTEIKALATGKPPPAPETRIGGGRVIRGAARQLRGFVQARRGLRKEVHRWTIGYRLGETGAMLNLDLRQFHLLAPPGERAWADPFAVRRNGRDYIFFEETLSHLGRGRIAMIELRPDGSTTDPEPVLELDHHLSYPFLFEWGPDLFMIPEATAGRRIEVFRCEAFPYTWRSHAVLMEDVNAADTTLVRHGGRWWMFTTIAEGGTWNVEELHLFHADSPFGPWVPHDANPVVSDVRRGRSAGGIWTRNDRLIRPAQDCALSYGGAIRLHEVTVLTEREYQEHEIDVVVPNALPQATGVHTVNSTEGLTVIDVRLRRPR